VRVLPTLVDKTEFRPASVFHEAVSIDIAVMVNPSECTFDVRPNTLDERAISRALVIRAGENDKKRRCVDGAVVTLERDLAQGGHLTRACLVQHLARLSVFLGVLRLRLCSGEIRQNPARESGIEPEALEGSNNSVSSKFRAVPGNASVRIRSMRSF